MKMFFCLLAIAGVLFLIWGSVVVVSMLLISP